MALLYVTAQRGGAGTSTVAAHLAAAAAEAGRETLLLTGAHQADLDLFFAERDGDGAITAADAVWETGARAGAHLIVAALQDFSVEAAGALARRAQETRPDALVVVDMGVQPAAVLRSGEDGPVVLLVMRADAASLLSASALTKPAEGDEGAGPVALPLVCLNQFDPRRALSRDVDTLVQDLFGDHHLGRIVADAAIADAAADGAVLAPAASEHSQGARDINALAQRLQAPLFARDAAAVEDRANAATPDSAAQPASVRSNAAA